MLRKLSFVRFAVSFLCFLTVACAGSAWASGPSEQVLHSFSDVPPDGGFAYGTVFVDSLGNIYGTTPGGGGRGGCDEGGAAGCGVAFELSPNSSGTYAYHILHIFTGGRDGGSPQAGLLPDQSGNFYGVTIEPSMVFALSPANGGYASNSITYLNGRSTGYYPIAGLVFDGAGNLYATARWGGSGHCDDGCGVVFELSPLPGGTWREQIIYSFQGGTQGNSPVSALVFDAAGNLYGVTNEGGAYSAGTLFELSPSASGAWTFTLVHSFGGSGDGVEPLGVLAVDASGDIFGTAPSGGASGYGIAWEASPQSGGGFSYHIIHNFGSQAGYSLYPSSGLISDNAGNLYGTGFEGGSAGTGTVFKLVHSSGFEWQEQILHSFTGGKTDGGNPQSGVSFDAAGNIYGLTLYGGKYNWGTVYKITP